MALSKKIAHLRTAVISLAGARQFILHSFTTLTVGAVAIGCVLYSTAETDGPTNAGLTPPASPGGKWAHAVMHSVAGSPNNRDGPFAALTIDGDGLLYGTTTFGGTSDSGTAISFKP